MQGTLYAVLKTKDDKLKIRSHFRFSSLGLPALRSALGRTRRVSSSFEKWHL